MKKLTITVDEDVYNGLYSNIGRGNISSFLNDAARTLMEDINANNDQYTKRGTHLLARMIGKNTVNLTTDEIMNLTRDS